MRKSLQAFFLIMGRASVFWLGALGVFILSLLVTGLAEPDRTFIEHYADSVFVAAFAFPAGAGLLAGAVIQEFQHTTFATFLPAIRFRLATGFMVTGLLVSLVVVGLIATISSTPHDLAVLFAVGVGAYCLGGILIDPLSGWMTSLNVTLVLAVILSSHQLDLIAGEHPWPTFMMSIGVAAFSVSRLFARATFRRKPFRVTAPLPGRFSLEKTHQYRRHKMIQGGPVKSGWLTGYLGQNMWLWTRAAIHETYGAHVLKTFLKAVARAWPLVPLFLIYAWEDKGEMRFSEALAKSLNDALFRSPFQPQFGEHGGPYPMVMIVIAVAGILTALLSPVALGGALSYPLSRFQRATVQFRGGLADTAILLLIASPCLLAIGHLAGWFVGYEIRFDFMPFFLRVLLLTLVLMPLGYWGRVQLQEATWRKTENKLVGLILGICGFVVLVGFLTLVVTQLFTSPIMELGVLSIAVLVSRMIYWRSLVSFYTTADLA